MSAQLIVSAIAPNRPGMTNDIVQLVQSFGATISESHMTVMSKEFAVIMEVTGPWNALTKLEHQLPVKAQQLGMLTMIKRSEKPQSNSAQTPYRVTFSNISDRTVIKDITEFFAENTINIEELNCRTLLSPQSERFSGEVKLTVSLTEQQSAEDIRLKFEQFCHAKSLSAEITPLKNS
ncbi:MAG: hypothetical protein HWE11_07530 [Gammaproteobacteria bacterium]|nr:hypothetical protein [Gammaproteobacteria bacterium]